MTIETTSIYGCDFCGATLTESSETGVEIVRLLGNVPKGWAKITWYEPGEPNELPRTEISRIYCDECKPILRQRLHQATGNEDLA